MEMESVEVGNGFVLTSAFELEYSWMVDFGRIIVYIYTLILTPLIPQDAPGKRGCDVIRIMAMFPTY